MPTQLRIFASEVPGTTSLAVYGMNTSCYQPPQEPPCTPPDLPCCVLCPRLLLTPVQPCCLHTYTSTAGKEFVRHKVASCSVWSALDPSLLVLGPLPAFPARATDLQVQGRAEVWWYYDNNW